MGPQCTQCHNNCTCVHSHMQMYRERGQSIEMELASVQAQLADARRHICALTTTLTQSATAIQTALQASRTSNMSPFKTTLPPLRGVAMSQSTQPRDRGCWLHCSSSSPPPPSPPAQPHTSHHTHQEIWVLCHLH